jgi:hypothetical protein
MTVLSSLPHLPTRLALPDGASVSLPDVVKAVLEFSQAFGTLAASAWELDEMWIAQPRDDPTGWITIQIKLRPEPREIDTPTVIPSTEPPP